MSGLFGSIARGVGLGLNKTLQEAQQQKKLRDQQLNQLLLSGFERTREPQGGGLGQFFQDLIAPQPLDPTQFEKRFTPQQFTLGDTRFETTEGGPARIVAQAPAPPKATPQPEPLFDRQTGMLHRLDTQGQVIDSVDLRAQFRDEEKEEVDFNRAFTQQKVNPDTGNMETWVVFSDRKGNIKEKRVDALTQPGPEKVLAPPEEVPTPAELTKQIGAYQHVLNALEGKVEDERLNVDQMTDQEKEALFKKIRENMTAVLHKLAEGGDVAGLQQMTDFADQQLAETDDVQIQDALLEFMADIAEVATQATDPAAAGPGLSPGQQKRLGLR